MIHLTVGYYSNGTKKENGVISENLADHIQYNLQFRPGRAFFVDGLCLNNGYLPTERIVEIEKELRGLRASIDTIPYQ